MEHWKRPLNWVCWQGIPARVWRFPHLFPPGVCAESPPPPLACPHSGKCIPVFHSPYKARSEGYIILDDGDISMVAREMKMDKLKLLEQLKKKRLLYLTGSCRGYQVKV